MKDINKLVRVPKPTRGEIPQEEYKKIVEEYKQMDQDKLIHLIHLHRQDCQALQRLEQSYENAMYSFGWFGGYHKIIDYENELWCYDQLHDESENFLRKQDIAQTMTPYAPKEYNADRSTKLNDMLRKLRDE